jgi:phosphatidylserine decarboxylase
MSVFNVHINRNPISGNVEKIEYKKGSFLNAAYEEASINNEQNKVYINGNIRLVVVQIAGLIARRIKCFIKVGDTVKKGDYLGLIQFGSRLDITMPKNVSVKVKIGDKVKAGFSIIGEVDN